MKYTFKILAIFLLLGFGLQAQTPQNSWNLEFGGIYPRLINHGYDYAGNMNFGGYFGFERNFSEHVGLRMQAEFTSLQGYYGADLSSRINSFTANLDVMYFFVPCETASPFFTFGAGPIVYMLDDDRPNKGINSFNIAYQINSGLGIDWALSADWKFRTELNYHTVIDSKFDGIDGASQGGILGGQYKSYLSINIGFDYTLSKGNPSKYCQIYDGIIPEMKDMTDYNRIEDMIKAHIPREVTKEIVVEKPVKASGASSDRWILVGVNFDFNSAKLTPDSYPILYDAAKTLLVNIDTRVEIQGYTDNIGSESYNKALSQKRADIVKNYLVAKGVSASRLTAVGMGESNPVFDNKTADGRAMNRRIEFKVE